MDTLFPEGMNFLQVTNINHSFPEPMGEAEWGVWVKSRLPHWHTITLLLTLQAMVTVPADCKWSIKGEMAKMD